MGMVGMVGVRFTWLLWICASIPIFFEPLWVFFLQHSSLCSRVHIATGVSQRLFARQPGAAYVKGKQSERVVWRAVDQGETKNKTQIVGFVLFFYLFFFFHLVGEGQCVFVSVKEANLTATRPLSLSQRLQQQFIVLMWNRVSLVHILFLSKKILRMLMRTKLLPRYSFKHLHLKTASEPLCQEV